MQNKVAFSVNEMAKRTGLSRSFLYLEMKAGALETLKVGRRRLVTAEAEAAYLARHRDAARAASPTPGQSSLPPPPRESGRARFSMSDDDDSRPLDHIRHLSARANI